MIPLVNNEKVNCMTDKRIVYVVEYSTDKGWMMLKDDTHSLTFNVLEAKRHKSFDEAMSFRNICLDISGNFHSYRISEYEVTTKLLNQW